MDEIRIGSYVFKKCEEGVYVNEQGDKLYIDEGVPLEEQRGLWVQRHDGVTLFMKKMKPYSRSEDRFVYWAEVQAPYKLPWWETDNVTFTTSYARVIERFISKKCMGETHFL